MSFPVMTSTTLRPAEAPTLYFIGVTTGRSSIQKVFPRWAGRLGLDGARLQGVDLPLHADPGEYRRVVEFIASDELSMGALVTTHKIDLYRACADLFDIVDPHAKMMGETSCLSKSELGLVAHAKDPISSGLALDAFIPAGHWAATGAEALSMGAGGSTIAITWYLSRPERGADRPSRIVVTNRSQERLDHLRAVHERLGTDTPFDYVLAPETPRNDAAVAALAPGSLVVNATGLGKDAPGSPLGDAARFPRGGLAWDLNYRGDLVFLRQARAQREERDLHVEDGWTYFLHGWTQVIAEVFHIAIPETGPEFDTLSELAQATR
ncbi:shikimate dehydrogenase [Streptosporangium fragile]|uniref:Shikimate dehydrogenase n=1 Tax=Streptosporangium fragile TaxID=46186 RepID=A0ABN3W6K6_9ACTN